MLSKDELRTRIEAELLTGADSQTLANKYDTSYQTINLWKKKLLAEKPETDISDLTQQTKASLEIIRDKAKDAAPAVGGKIDKLIDGVQGLKELEPEFHTAMSKAVKLAQNFLDSDDVSIKEWQMITTTLATAYGAIFNKAGTVVNVANTQVSASSENLSFFKQSQKV